MTDDSLQSLEQLQALKQRTALEKLQALKKLQDDFYQAIFHPNEETIKQASTYIVGTDALTEEDRLSIYRDSILGGITAGLTGIFPVCVKLVGEKYFTHMVAGYLKEYPSGSPDLGNYGEHLPTYIAQFKPAKALVYLSDVAKLEWAWHQAFNAPDEHDLTVDSASSELEVESALKPVSKLKPLSELDHVAEDSFPDIRFKVVSSASLISSDYPVHHIWQVNQNDYEGGQSVSLDEGQAKLLVWRSADYGMRVDALNENEYRFIEGLLEGKTFGYIAEAAYPQALGEILQRCIQMGLIQSFSV